MRRARSRRRAARPDVGPALAAASGVASRTLRTARSRKTTIRRRRDAAPLTILQINDVYSTLPVDGLGGLARVATLKQQLAAAGRTPLLVLAGDFLSPSVASSVFKGEQMIAALNAAGLDIATLGNHEFDFGTRRRSSQRMARSASGSGSSSNVIDTDDRQADRRRRALRRPDVRHAEGRLHRPVPDDQRDQPGQARRASGSIDPARGGGAVPAGAQARRRQRHRRGHAPGVRGRPRARASAFPRSISSSAATSTTRSRRRRTARSSARPDRTRKCVARIDVDRRPSGVGRALLRADARSRARSPTTRRPPAVVKAYEDRLGTELEHRASASSAVPLDARRACTSARGETNLGDLVADAMRADVGADVAIVNAGSIRGDRVYPAGPLDAAHAHRDASVRQRRSARSPSPGASCCRRSTAASRSCRSAAGQFPQVSGLTMRVDATAPAGDRVRDVRVGGQPLDREQDLHASRCRTTC